jgi:DNA-binding MarR family transcriptional regulator
VSTQSKPKPGKMQTSMSGAPHSGAPRRLPTTRARHTAKGSTAEQERQIREELQRRALDSLIARMQWDIQLHYMVFTRTSRLLACGLRAPLDLEILVLVYYEDDKSWYGAELARRLDVSAATASRALASLSDRGLISREPRPRAGAAVHATPEGRKALLDAFSEWLTPEVAVELSRRKHDAVELVAELTLRLCGLMPRGEVMRWLRGRLIGGRRPIDLIAAGELQQLDDLLDELERRHAAA